VAGRIVVTGLLIALIVLWRPLLRPAGAGAILVLDIYTSALYGHNAATLMTPEPRVSDTTETFADVDMRVSWWRPGWGERHPAVMLVNGATPVGNDDAETRRLGEALARAGYLVMLPEFPFIKEGHLDRRATAIIDDAFARLRAVPETRGLSAGAFGFSVGGGMLLAAAARGGALADASYLGALGAYFDLDTYLASVVSGMQGGAALTPWEPAAEVRSRLPVVAAEALADPVDRALVVDALKTSGGRLSEVPPSGLGPEAVSLWVALATVDHDLALARFRMLPASLRVVFDDLSPRSGWSALRPPVFWIHDVGDRFEPVGEAFAAEAAARPGGMRLQRTRLLSHAAALDDRARAQGLAFWVGELAGLIGFSSSVLRAGG
jgi:dienelactone hydrolase